MRYEFAAEAVGAMLFDSAGLWIPIHSAVQNYHGEMKLAFVQCQDGRYENEACIGQGSRTARKETSSDLARSSKFEV